MNDNFDHIDKLELELAKFVRRVAATRNAFLKYKDFNRSIYLLLLKIEKAGPISIKSLAESFQLDISTMTRQTASLEAKGFIKRVSSHKDARVSLIEITPVGRDQLNEVKNERQQFYADFLNEWSMDGKSLKIGDNIVEDLKDNRNLDFHFVSKNLAHSVLE